MCGRFRVDDTPALHSMLEQLAVLAEIRLSPDVAPGSNISIIRQLPTRHRLATRATWWLMIDPATGKPNYKYASFNSRSDKLDQPRSLAYQPYRESRCIIPATAFVEGLGDRQTYHMIEHPDDAIAFGGLYREYHVAGDPDRPMFAASIITLPPAAGWEDIHPKSLPLMLDYRDKTLVDRWLDPEFRDVEEFVPLLEPRIRRPQRVTPIERPSLWNPIGESRIIPA